MSKSMYASGFHVGMAVGLAVGWAVVLNAGKRKEEKRSSSHLHDEVGHNPAVPHVHPVAKGVEDPCHTHLHPVLLLVCICEQTRKRGRPCEHGADRESDVGMSGVTLGVTTVATVAFTN